MAQIKLCPMKRSQVLDMFPYRFAFDPAQQIGDSFVIAQDAHETYAEVEAWCVEQMGPAGVRWQRNHWNFYLRDEVDAAAFRLWWC